MCWLSVSHSQIIRLPNFRTMFSKYISVRENSYRGSERGKMQINSNSQLNRYSIGIFIGFVCWLTVPFSNCSSNLLKSGSCNQIYLGIDNKRTNLRCVTKSRVVLVIISILNAIDIWFVPGDAAQTHKFYGNFFFASNFAMLQRLIIEGTGPNKLVN